LFRELRQKRITAGETSPNFHKTEATLFLGLFNAETYLDSLLEQISSQSVALPMIVVDNCSTDDTWANIQAWLSIFPGQLVLVRNPINLGASGSLYVNSDLIETPWFITMHQDDFYKRNHFETLVEAIKKSTPDTLCITTEMGSIGLRGETQSCPPRASWLLPDFEPATIFTSNLKIHNVPYPAAAFRASVFFDNAVPWETTAFPDTEWVLSVASLGRFTFVEKETMLYRENPSSESHSIESEEKLFGASLALLRVFGSKSFEDLCLSRPREDRARFSTSVLEGVRFRLGHSPHSELVVTFASQKMAASWGYSESGTNSQLINTFKSIGAKFPVELLTSLNLFFENSPTHALPKAADSLQGNNAQGPRLSLFKALLKMYGRMPTGARRTTARIAGVAIRFFKVESIWNFRWK
jgi:hypothetical protein